MKLSLRLDVKKYGMSAKQIRWNDTFLKSERKDCK